MTTGALPWLQAWGGLTGCFFLGNLRVFGINEVIDQLWVVGFWKQCFLFSLRVCVRVLVHGCARARVCFEQVFQKENVLLLNVLYFQFSVQLNLCLIFCTLWKIDKYNAVRSVESLVFITARKRKTIRVYIVVVEMRFTDPLGAGRCVNPCLPSVLPQPSFPLSGRRSPSVGVSKLWASPSLWRCGGQDEQRSACSIGSAWMELALRCLAVFSCVSLVFLPDPPPRLWFAVAVIWFYCFLFSWHSLPQAYFNVFLFVLPPVPGGLLSDMFSLSQGSFFHGLGCAQHLAWCCGKSSQEKVGHDPLERWMLFTPISQCAVSFTV